MEIFDRFIEAFLTVTAIAVAFAWLAVLGRGLHLLVEWL